MDEYSKYSSKLIEKFALSYIIIAVYLSNVYRKSAPGIRIIMVKRFRFLESTFLILRG